MTSFYRTEPYGDTNVYRCRLCRFDTLSERAIEAHNCGPVPASALAPPSEPAGGAARPIRPSVDDLKAAWVTYAHALGVDTEGLTKHDLIEVTSVTD